MSYSKKITMGTNKLQQMKNEARKRAEAVAKEARERISKEYLSVISTFYGEYEPRYYYRHFNNNYGESGLLKSGLGHTFNKYYKNINNRTYVGGIRISNTNMFTDYEGSTENVLSSFLNGWHGVPNYYGIKASIDTLPHMINFKRKLINELLNKYKL